MNQLNTMNQLNAMTIGEWQQAGDYFEFEGHQYFYRTSHSSSHRTSHRTSHGVEEPKQMPCLLLIHGFPTCSWDWQPVWDQLKQHFFLVTMDMLGFGFSDKPRDHSYLIFKQADAQIALLQKLGINKAHVFSHDYGNTVAQELLAREAEDRQDKILVQSLLLLNGGIFPETHQPILAQRMLLSRLGFLFVHFIGFRKFHSSMDEICEVKMPLEMIKGYWFGLNYNGGRKVFPKIIQYMKQRSQYRSRWVRALECFSKPLRLIDGLKDPVSGAHMVKRYRELIHQGDVVELESIGHYPQVEAPDEVVHYGLEFWKSVLNKAS